MFTKTGYLHLTYIFSIIVMVRVLDSQSWSPGFKTGGWLQGQLSQPFILPPGTPGKWVVKSKLSHSGSVALRKVHPIYKKGP